MSVEEKMNTRELLKDKKRIVIKIGSSSLMHEDTEKLNLLKIEKLVRILVDIKNSYPCVIRGNCCWKKYNRTSQQT